MKNVLSYLILVFLISTCLFSFSSRKKIIVIDPGHGGNDRGAVYYPYEEKVIVQNIAEKIKKENKNPNIEIILTRENDQYPSLSERSDFINKLNPDFVISLHVNNSLKKSLSGKEIFTQPNESSKILAQKLSSILTECKVLSDKNFHILRETKSPTILVELGYLSNENDRSYLLSKEGQEKLSHQILECIEKSS